MGKGNKGKQRRGRGRAARDPEIPGVTTPLATVPDAPEATPDGVDAMLSESINQPEGEPAVDEPAEPELGDLAGLDGPQWFIDGQATDEEEVAMMISDWSMYAQASLSGGADSPEEAALDADVLMHEQLKRHAVMARNMADPEPTQ